MTVLKELHQIVGGQTTVRTSKLKPLLQQLTEEIAAGAAESNTLEELTKLQKEVERKEAVIVRLQEESKQHTLVRSRQKAAMQDYENLKRNYSRLKDEYNALLGSKAKDKAKLKEVNRELTDCQVLLARAKKTMKKAGIEFK